MHQVDHGVPEQVDPDVRLRRFTTILCRKFDKSRERAFCCYMSTSFYEQQAITNDELTEDIKGQVSGTGEHTEFLKNMHSIGSGIKASTDRSPQFFDQLKGKPGKVFVFFEGFPFMNFYRALACVGLEVDVKSSMSIVIITKVRIRGKLATSQEH